MEELPTGAVRTVNLRVAINAAAVDRKNRHRVARIGRMSSCRVMTALAQPRPRDLQQIVVDGAVRIMTVQAVFDHRRMLPEERTALFRMALEAYVINSRFLQQALRIAAVRIVTVRAFHFAFRQRHM